MKVTKCAVCGDEFAPVSADDSLCPRCWVLARGEEYKWHPHHWHGTGRQPRRRVPVLWALLAVTLSLCVMLLMGVVLFVAVALLGGWLADPALDRVLSPIVFRGGFGLLLLSCVIGLALVAQYAFREIVLKWWRRVPPWAT